MRVLVLHSRYLSGPASGENRVVEDELRLLGEFGHTTATWQPSVDATASSPRMATQAIWSRSATRTVRQLVVDFRPDVVHVHSVYPRLSPAIIRTLPATLPVVLTLHNFRLMCLPATYLRSGRICEDCAGRIPWRGVAHACYRGSRTASAALATSLALHRGLGSFARVDRFLAVSEFVREKHIEAGLDPAKICVKSNFAWPATRREGPGRYFFFLGRLSGEKGLSTILRTIPESSELVVAGDGPDRSRLELEAPARVSFVGQVDSQRAQELLRHARALVVPSQWYEGQPRVIVEAFAAGIPVLASRIGGLPELVDHGRNGYLSEPDRDSDWHEALRLLADEHRSKQFGEEAYRTWEARFNPDRAISELEAAYEGVVRLRGSGR